MKTNFLSNTVLRIACSINAQDWLTVKTSIFGICPQMLDPVPPKVDKKRAFYRILSTTDSKSGPRDATSRQKQRPSLNFCLPPTQNPDPAPPRSSARCNATTSHQPALHFQCKKAESPLHPRKFRIDHPNVPYLTTITEQGAF